ncbi:hypothetical protein OG21DRAFT_1512237 [Imleria badia]|nr:hypothetical protein OG21DRAFT_1512237 [Imleria badia]
MILPLASLFSSWGALHAAHPQIKPLTMGDLHDTDFPKGSGYGGPNAVCPPGLVLHQHVGSHNILCTFCLRHSPYTRLTVTICAHHPVQYVLVVAPIPLLQDYYPSTSKEAVKLRTKLGPAYRYYRNGALLVGPRSCSKTSGRTGDQSSLVEARQVWVCPRFASAVTLVMLGFPPRRRTR